MLDRIANGWYSNMEVHGLISDFAGAHRLDKGTKGGDGHPNLVTATHNTDLFVWGRWWQWG